MGRQKSKQKYDPEEISAASKRITRGLNPINKKALRKQTLVKSLEKREAMAKKVQQQLAGKSLDDLLGSLPESAPVAPPNALKSLNARTKKATERLTLHETSRFKQQVGLSLADIKTRLKQNHDSQ